MVIPAGAGSEEVHAQVRHGGVRWARLLLPRVRGGDRDGLRPLHQHQPPPGDRAEPPPLPHAAMVARPDRVGVGTRF